MSGGTRSMIRGAIWVLVLVLSCVCQGQAIYVDAAATGANDGNITVSPEIAVTLHAAK